MRLRIHLSIVLPVVLASLVARAQSASRLSPPVRWLDNVIVNRDRVHLSDLLPADSDPGLRARVEGIDLGQAPEPGSFRVLTAAELREITGGRLAVELSTQLPAEIIVRREGWPISPERLREALSVAKLPLTNVDVLGSPTTRRANAGLRVAATQPGRSPSVFLVRFECRERSNCAPFWGKIKSMENLSQPPLARTLLSNAEHRVTPLVRPGQMALLVSDEPGMEIRLRVRPLGRAGIGERVKVFDPGTRRTFLARVKAANLVMSDLEEAR